MECFRKNILNGVNEIDIDTLLIPESDILYNLYQEPFIDQRILSELTGHSLGMVNKSIRNLMANGFLNGDVQLTNQAQEYIKANSPKNAIILAAEYGMRMVPINLSTPKALLKVNGERLIDRLINQIREVGITDITVIVGFMKESFEYLIDEYGVDLLN